ncbi:unnamed protein product [Cochlearia groenlandica]
MVYGLICYVLRLCHDHLSDYFPKAVDDRVNVRENESISFNSRENDYFASENASIDGFIEPCHCSLLSDENLYKYTPFKDFWGI